MLSVFAVMSAYMAIRQENVLAKSLGAGGSVDIYFFHVCYVVDLLSIYVKRLFFLNFCKI